uniref:Replicative DNA helicase n=1 Tax=Acrochaetium secundatum TaxID=209631 RepID=A0A4D6BMB6_9FLOR|nr:replication helicase subunit [Acrochaetium secundatum]QBX88378.1 replication helicase subunit [Acrochaetium secundatum]
MLDKQSVLKYNEQLPPQHNLAEEILLGGILLNFQVVEMTMQELTTESFATEIHQLIYATIIKIYLQDGYVNSIILINNLWNLGLLAKIGGINKILNLLRQAQVFVSSNIIENTMPYYIDLVKDKYIRRLLIQYGYNIIALAYLSSIEYSTAFFKAEKYLANIKLLTINKKADTVYKSLASLLFNLRSNHKTNNFIRHMSGLASLDKLTYGFAKGDLIVIAGRPSMGKTSLSLNIAYNILKKQHYGVSIFSLEMSREQILYKLLSIASSISTNNIRLGQLTSHEWNQLQLVGSKLINSLIEIDDTANLSISDLTLKAKTTYKKNSGMSLLIIDYLQLIQLHNISFANRTEELSLITRSLKILAKELQVPIIVLSQLNRNVESRINKKPMLADLRESGCIIKYSYIIKWKNKGISLIRYKRSIDHKDNLNIFSRHQFQVYSQFPYHIIISDRQYTYRIVGNSSDLIAVTHNHSLLSRYDWKRNDSFKYFSMLYAIRQIDKRQKIILYYLKKIQLCYKQYVQDLIMYEERNFITNNNLIIHNSIEQDADLVLLLYRDSYYNIKSDNNNLTDIIIAKHRNGPVGTVELYFKPETSIFHGI